jgi:hypothetical protein
MESVLNKSMLDKIVKIKLLRPIILVVMGVFLITWIIIDFVFGLEGE